MEARGLTCGSLCISAHRCTDSRVCKEKLCQDDKIDSEKYKIMFKNTLTMKSQGPVQEQICFVVCPL